MADGKKIGEGMLSEMAKRGLEELQNAVLQQPPVEAPQSNEPPMYDPANAIPRGPSKESKGMSR